MRDFVSKKAKEIKPSGIRKFFDIVATRKDVISLGVGEPDFVTPWKIREAGVNCIRKGYTQYTSNKGMPALRQEISGYLKNRFSVDFSPENLIVTIGASEAIDITLRATIDDFDEVLIPDPSYVSYEPCVRLCGGVAKPVSTSAKDEFKLTKENLEKAITDKTKALIYSYPNNPTGATMSEADIKEIIPVILKHDLLIIADEIYAELTYGKNHCSIASFPELKDRVVLISGFSKSFAMTGWRIGYMGAPTEIINGALKIHQYATMCAPIFSQYAGLEALEQGKLDDFAVVEEMRKEYDRRRNFVYKSFNEMGLKCFEPTGSFYVFPSVESLGMTGEEFATKLLEKANVAVVPGGAFGKFGEKHIRCSYAYSMKELVEAIERIKTFVKEIKN